MKILVLDDEQLDLFIAKKLLGMEFVVEGFTSIADTVKWAQHNNFDVVLIDYYLSQGKVATDVLKQLPANDHAFKAFVLSNHVDENQIRELKDAGFHGVIYKPLSLEKFKTYLDAEGFKA